MTTNEIVFFLRTQILSDISNQELANIALKIFNTNNSMMSKKLNTFLPELIAMDMGKDFYLSKQYILESLWKILEDESNQIIFNNDSWYSPKESIDYLIMQTKSDSLSLSEVLKECHDKFKFNDLQALLFIKNFIAKLNNRNKFYYDIPKKWFINPTETEKIIFKNK